MHRTVTFTLNATLSLRRRTYVMAHAYTPEAILRCMRLGVKCIEHGNLLNEVAVRVKEFDL